MNINSEYTESESELDAETAMASCMEGISSILLEPAMNKGELNEEDQTLLGIIGVTLKIIAEKAHAYEKMTDESNSQNFSRN